MDNLYTLTVYSGADVIAQMKHLTKKEAKYHKKQILSMIQGEVKKPSIEIKGER